MKNKLKWKQKWLDDKSGYWFSAKVPILNWEYIIDCINIEENKCPLYKAGVFLSKYDDDVVNICKKNYKQEQAAKKACEKHLDAIINKIKQFFI